MKAFFFVFAVVFLAATSLCAPTDKPEESRDRRSYLSGDYATVYSGALPYYGYGDAYRGFGSGYGYALSPAYGHGYGLGRSYGWW